MPAIKKTAAAEEKTAQISAADLEAAVVDFVLAKKEAWIRAEAVRIQAEQARIEAERQANKVRIDVERTWIESGIQAEKILLETERTRVVSEKMAGQVRVESEDFQKEPARTQMGRGKGQSFPEEAISGLPEAFKKIGCQFTLISHNRSMVDYAHNILGTVDIFLENADCAMAVAVTGTLKRKQVNNHIAAMKKIRRYAVLHGDKRKFFGALAAALVDDDAGKYALQQGFYIIETTQGITITAPASGAKSW
jgi:hypothetical protein